MYSSLQTLSKGWSDTERDTGIVRQLVRYKEGCRHWVGTGQVQKSYRDCSGTSIILGLVLQVHINSSFYTLPKLFLPTHDNHNPTLKFPSNPPYNKIKITTIQVLLHLPTVHVVPHCLLIDNIPSFTGWFVNPYWFTCIIDFFVMHRCQEYPLVGVLNKGNSTLRFLQLKKSLRYILFLLFIAVCPVSTI